MKKNKSWEQLAKYFAGELSTEEHEKMESWIQEDPKREKQIDRLYEVWRETENPPYQLDVDQAWTKLSGDIDEYEKSKIELAPRDSKPGEGFNLPIERQARQKIKQPGTVWRRVMLVAATILIAVLAGVFSYQIQLQNQADTVSEDQNRVYETRNGEQATYVLSDGSKVILHADSRLEISSDYNKEDRELFLEGEAYFETSHNPEKPFIVHSQHAYTRVLGTRFLVQAWRESDNTVEVVVSEGEVAFGNSLNKGSAQGKNEVFITKNKMGVLSAGETPIVTDVTNMSWYMGWTEGRLEFENRALNEVLPRLERWYNIEIRVEDEEIREQKITAEIDYSQSMTEVLQGIALTLDLEVDRVDRKITFRSADNNNE